MTIRTVIADSSSTSDPQLLSTFDWEKVTFGKFAECTGAGHMNFANFFGGCPLLEFRLVLAYKGISKFVSDAEKKLLQENPNAPIKHNPWNISGLISANPHLVKPLTDHDNYIAAQLVANSADWLGEETSEDNVRKFFLRPSIRTKKKDPKGKVVTIPPEVKFKVPSHADGTPIVSIYDQWNNLVYFKSSKDELNIKDELERNTPDASGNVYGPYDSPTTLLKGRDEVIVVAQYSGIHKGEALCSGSWVVKRIKKTQPKAATGMLFRENFEEETVAADASASPPTTDNTPVKQSVGSKRSREDGGDDDTSPTKKLAIDSTSILDIANAITSSATETSSSSSDVPSLESA